jgi:hypothetical protein
VTINKKYAGSFDRAKDERELMDEIYLLAGSEAYRGHRMHAIVGRSRPEVIAWYFAENPEIKRWVDHSIEAGTCADASAELRAKKEEFSRWLHEQREDLPKPESNPQFADGRVLISHNAEGRFGQGLKDITAKRRLRPLRRA